MAKAHCKCQEEECECPEWIFTFADLVMLMMGFFVVLWVLKPAPTGSNNNPEALDPEVLAKIRDAFNYVPDPKSKDPVDIYMLLKKLEKLDPRKNPGDGGKTKLEQHGIVGTDPDVQTVRIGKQYIVGGRLLFEVGKADLTSDTIKQLDQIAAVIRGHRKVVQVKGHTSLDDLPESASAQDRMNLSVRRAQAVADYLTAHGVEPEILRVQGCSTFEPIVQGVYTPDARLANRRVEVQASEILVNELQGTTTTPVTPVEPPASQPGP